MSELKPGAKCYAKKVSIHIDGNEYSYSAPRGKKFALILMTDEEPDNTKGITCDDFLSNCGYEQTNP